MDCLVLIEICFCCKSLVTLAAMIWFLPSVTSLMYFKIVFLCKRLITIAAMIWFHPSVKCFMNLKFVFLCKSFVTFNTFIWYCLSMISLMTWQIMFFFCKSLITVSALINFLPIVDSLMATEIYFFVWKPCHTGCNDTVSPQCEFFDVYHAFFVLWKHYPTGCIDIVYHECDFLCTLRCPLGAKSLVTFAAMIWALCWRNMLVHTMLAYDNSILIEFYCLKRSHFLEKALSQILHWYGLASVWDLLCNKRLQFLEKVWPQNGIDISLVEFQ